MEVTKIDSSLSAKRHQNWCLFCFLAITMIFRLSPDSIEVSHNTAQSEKPVVFMHIVS